MHRLLTGYSQYYNRRYQRIKHLLQGRHKAILCQSDRYLAELVRYIHLNPTSEKLGARSWGQACNSAIQTLSPPLQEGQNSRFPVSRFAHTAASWVRMQGPDIHTVAQLLGHKDLRMAVRYQHLSPSFLAEAVGRLDAIFGSLRYQDVTAPKCLKQSPL